MIAFIALSALLAVANAQYNQGYQQPAPSHYQQQPQQYQPQPQAYQPQPAYHAPQSQPQSNPAAVHYVNIGAQLAGDYKFGYDTGKGRDQSFREETRLPDGTVQGAYGYVDETGKQRVIKYTAGKNGYQVEGDGIPKAPPAPAQPAPAPAHQPAQNQYNDGQYNSNQYDDGQYRPQNGYY